MTNTQKARTARRRTARRAVPSLAAAALAAGTLTVGTLAATTAPAAAYNYVPAGAGDRWGVHDAANPGLDTGSVRDTTGGALQGYGGLRVEVEGGTSRLNGILLRGFGLTYDGRETFTSTRGVEVDGVVVRRELVVPAGQSYGRFLDSFTNTTRKPVTVLVAFGGQVGYDTGENQSELGSTGDGDTAITAADGWASWHTPTTAAGGPSQNGPSATVFGTPGEADALTRMGTFLHDPFDTPLPTDGDEANHPGFVTTLTIAPGDTASLLRYVVTGMPEGRAVAGATRPAGSEVAKVEGLAATLAGLPAVAGLTLSELCSVANFDPAALGIDEADCAQAPQVPFAGGATGAVSATTAATTSSYDVVGKTITELVADLEAGRTSSQQIVRAYLDRIAAYDQGPVGLHSVITVAPDAMAQARAADKARKAGDKRPFLGIPVLAKDIIDTKDMPTTGGSLVFDGYQPEEDAFQVARMREAGAIILGKANLAEFANDGHYSPNAYGMVWNAFDPSRSSIGSSGGSAVAVASSFAAAAWGTQTGDSLWGPAGAASLYSLRGTDGMQSSGGTMPLTLIQDYVGWIAQSIEDLAMLLDVTAVDNPDDVLDDVANGHRPTDWGTALKPGALKGKVIGVPETAFDDPFGTTAVSDVLEAQFANFEKAGATIKVVPDFDDAPERGDYGDLGYEGWAQWIDAHPDNPYTLPEQITHNPLRVPYQRRAGEYTGTGRMTYQQQRDFEAYRATYRDNIAAWMDENGADAILYPAELSEIHLNDSINPSFGRKDPQSSAAGVPTVIFPAGTTENGSPVGFQLQGKAFQDAELMGMAYAFDKVAEGRVLPKWTPPLRYDADAVPPPVTDADPLPQPTPAKLRLTVLERSVRATLPANGKARVRLPVGCASVGATCTGRAVVTLGGTKVARQAVRVAPGARRTVTVKLPAAATKKLRRGKTVTLRVRFAGTGRTAGSTPVRVAVRR
ncbi:amidase [Nocardioides sp. IC4_145]|uniref:amidase family protein n=1 Tax=Nocardioides sp. IC4_145 TaxID=2714037 RepID=UPI00140CDD04|nr:amidase family protein [Nocardioides sp. IC4_145]NHC25085.1 amidase [Nocardioides sp. IC4_145]